MKIAGVGSFIAMESASLLEHEIAGLKPLVLKRGRPTVAAYVDFDYDHFAAPNVAAIAAAIHPAIKRLARMLKRGHVKRFHRGELPRCVEMAHQAVSRQVAVTFIRYFDVQKGSMINRLQVVGAVRH